MHGENEGMYPAAAAAIHGTATDHGNCFPLFKSTLCIASCIASRIALCIALLHCALYHALQHALHCALQHALHCALHYALHHATLPSSSPPRLIVVFNCQDISFLFLLLLLLCFPLSSLVISSSVEERSFEKKSFLFFVIFQCTFLCNVHCAKGDRALPNRQGGK
jgi:hypothetical protein